MSTLVTGGTGYVGGAVVRALVKQGKRVRVLARPTSNIQALEALGVEIVYGDLFNTESLATALDGCDTLYHVAAIYELWVKDRQTLMRTAVEGTENALAAAHKAGVNKVVYTSTYLTIGQRSNETGTEATVHRGYFLSAYEEAKYKAEQVAYRYLDRGVPIVIVNPAGVYGPGDLKPTGQGLIKVLTGKTPILFPMRWGVVYLDDVGLGHVLAAEKGRVGERYLLCERTVTGEEFFGLACKLTGARLPPTVPAPLFLPMVWAGEAFSRVTHRPPLVSRDEFRMLTYGGSFDGSKAVRELGLQYTPLEVGLRQALAWYAAEGLIPDRSQPAS